MVEFARKPVTAGRDPNLAGNRPKTTLVTILRRSKVTDMSPTQKQFVLNCAVSKDSIPDIEFLMRTFRTGDLAVASPVPVSHGPKET